MEGLEERLTNVVQKKILDNIKKREMSCGVIMGNQKIQEKLRSYAGEEIKQIADNASD